MDLRFGAMNVFVSVDSSIFGIQSFWVIAAIGWNDGLVWGCVKTFGQEFIWVCMGGLLRSQAHMLFAEDSGANWMSLDLFQEFFVDFCRFHY